MLWRRDVLEAGGGIEALGTEIAEDAASTKLVHRADLRAHLASPPSRQPLGARRLRDVWARQVRWARLRRATFPLYFAPEVVTASLLTLAAAGVAGEGIGLSAPAAVMLAAAIWYGAEAALAARPGWPLAWSSPAAWMARDLALPALWLSAWMNARFVWRGNVMSADEERSPPKARRRRGRLNAAPRRCPSFPSWPGLTRPSILKRRAINATAFNLAGEPGWPGQARP